MSGLQDLLVDLSALAQQAKQLHWHVQGKDFRSVHLQIDEVVASARAYMDDVAERSVTLGVAVDGTPETVAKEHDLPPLPEAWVKDEEAVRLLAEGVERVAQRGRKVIEETEAEPVTQDLAIQVVSGLEKHLWMLRAQLVKR